MKTHYHKILLSAFAVLIVLSIIGTVNVAAVETPDQTIDVPGDAIQIQLQSNIRTMFRFRERTQLTLCANVGLELEINCDALRIGENDVIIEIEGENDLKMVMTCTREESQLGLMNGSLHRLRNRNTYRYLEGLCIAMECSAYGKGECRCDPECNCQCDCQCNCDPECTCQCDCQCNCDPECNCQCDCQCNCDPECNCQCDCQCNCDPECTCQCDCQCNCDPECTCQCESNYSHEGAFLKARLRIRATNQNRNGEWAYYDHENEDWITVNTIAQDGYLTTETSVLSTWTLLVPEETIFPIAGVVIIGSIFTIGIVVISVFYLKKRN